MLSTTPGERQYYYLTDGQNNNPPHIGAHLQALQSQRTDQPCKRAAILPTHPSPPTTPT